MKFDSRTPPRTLVTLDEDEALVAEGSSDQRLPDGWDYVNSRSYRAIRKLPRVTHGYAELAKANDDLRASVATLTDQLRDAESEVTDLREVRDQLAGEARALRKVRDEYIRRAQAAEKALTEIAAVTRDVFQDGVDG